jgi:hypothetical protein
MLSVLLGAATGVFACFRFLSFVGHRAVAGNALYAFAAAVGCAGLSRIRCCACTTPAARQFSVVGVPAALFGSVVGT